MDIPTGFILNSEDFQLTDTPRKSLVSKLKIILALQSTWLLHVYTYLVQWQQSHAWHPLVLNSVIAQWVLALIHLSAVNWHAHSTPERPTSNTQNWHITPRVCTLVHLLMNHHSSFTCYSLHMYSYSWCLHLLARRRQGGSAEPLPPSPSTKATEKNILALNLFYQQTMWAKLHQICLNSVF